MDKKIANQALYYTNDHSTFQLIKNNSQDSINIKTFDINDPNNSEEDDIIPAGLIYEYGNSALEDKNELLNKKRKRHSKFSGDNLKRKCKHLVIESVIEFINKKIYIEYKGDIGEGLLKKEILKLNQSQKKDSHVDFNKKFLYMSLKDILGQNITSKIKYYSGDHNKNLINELIYKKGVIFEKIFNTSFIECLEHFAGINIIEQLKGLKLFSELKEKIINKEGKNYCKNLELFLKEYRKRINEAKARKIRK